MSIKIAKKIDAEIISADASQIYKELNIGTAKITDEEMQGVKHYMIDIVNPGEDYSAGDFERDVNNILNKNSQRSENRKNIIITGGTGLYIRSITNGFAKLPSKDEKIRKDLENKNLDELQKILKKLDELYLSDKKTKE